MAADDSITFACGACGRSFRVARARAGHRAPCPGCGGALTVPDPGGAAPARTGPFDPTDVTHIPLRLPFYADNIRRRQRRLERPLAPADARPYVLRLFHEHVLQLGTIVLMAFGLLFVMSLLQDGLGGAVEMLLRQALWAAPMGGALYGLARFLLVPPAPRVNG